MEKPQWTDSPAISIDLDAPMSQRFAGLAGEPAQRSKHVIDTIKAEVPASALSKTKLLDLRTGYRFHRELKAIGHATAIDPQWLLAANVMYDFAARPLGCSTAALATPDGPVLARNMDWWPAELLAKASCVLDYLRGGERAFASAAWAGMVGVVTAMSGRGFALALNAVRCQEPPPKTAYPVVLHLRRVMEEARNFDQAVDMLSDVPLLAPALVTLVGTKNKERLTIERTPTRNAMGWAQGDQPLVTTNNYQMLREENANLDDDRFWASSCPRLEELNRLSDRLVEAGDFSDQALMQTLIAPGIFQPITAQHIIMRPAQNQFRLASPTTWPEMLDQPASRPTAALTDA